MADLVFAAGLILIVLLAALGGGHGILYSDAEHTAALRTLRSRGVLHLSFFSSPPEIERERERLGRVEKWAEVTFDGSELAAIRSWIRHGYWTCDQAMAEFEKRKQVAEIEARMKRAAIRKGSD